MKNIEGFVMSPVYETEFFKDSGWCSHSGNGARDESPQQLQGELMIQHSAELLS